MKALKHLPVWEGPGKLRGDEIIMYPSRMGSLQVHLRSFSIDGTRFESRFGKGPETVYYKASYFVKSQEESDRKCEAMWRNWTEQSSKENDTLRQEVKEKTILEDYRLQKKPRK